MLSCKCCKVKEGKSEKRCSVVEKITFISVGKQISVRKAPPHPKAVTNRPSDRENSKKQDEMKWWDDNERGKPKHSSAKPVSLPFTPKSEAEFLAIEQGPSRDRLATVRPGQYRSDHHSIWANILFKNSGPNLTFSHHTSYI